MGCPQVWADLPKQLPPIGKAVDGGGFFFGTVVALVVVYPQCMDLVPATSCADVCGAEARMSRATDAGVQEGLLRSSGVSAALPLLLLLSSSGVEDK